MGNFLASGITLSRLEQSGKSGEHALNIRKFDPDLLLQLKMITHGHKGALRTFVLRAIRKEVDEQLRPVRGARKSKLKLCAGCFKANEEALAPKEPVAVREAFPAGDQVEVGSIFAHLLSGDESVVEGLSGVPQGAAAKVSPPTPEEPQPSSIEVCKGLFVGEYRKPSEGWSVLSAAKEPWHREFVGYGAAGAPAGHPEFYAARRGNHLALNLIDVRVLGPNGERYVPEQVISAAMEFLDERLGAGDRVLVHCNQGKSRSPAIAFLYMRRKGLLRGNFEQCVSQFREKYPDFDPNPGIFEYLKEQCA